MLIQGNEYIYKPHWGEQLVGKHRSVVVVLDTTTDNITVLSGIPDELSPGQVIWTKDQDVVGVAWKHEPQYLGLIACTNRYSWIFLLKNGEYRKKYLNNCYRKYTYIKQENIMITFITQGSYLTKNALYTALELALMEIILFGYKGKLVLSHIIMHTRLCYEI